MQPAFLYLVDTVVHFFCALFLLRFAMQWRRIPFQNPLGGFVFRLTDWAVKPLRRVIPGLGGLDWASIGAAILLLLLYQSVLMLMGWIAVSVCFDHLNGCVEGGRMVFLPFLFHTLIAFLRVVIYLCIGLVLLEVILSWVNPWHPLAAPLRQLTQPLLAPVRRLIPPISGIDLSPLVVLVCLQALLILLSGA
ncbi:MAG: YggT family protein [Zoogloeaceae bacterium]|jgi:YggT family protein|nr:YggT family protein [Zoogloeaceae bacterium]